MGNGLVFRALVSTVFCWPWSPSALQRSQTVMSTVIRISMKLKHEILKGLIEQFHFFWVRIFVGLVSYVSKY